MQVSTGAVTKIQAHKDDWRTFSFKVNTSANCVAFAIPGNDYLWPLHIHTYIYRCTQPPQVSTPVAAHALGLAAGNFHLARDPSTEGIR